MHVFELCAELEDSRSVRQNFYPAELRAARASFFGLANYSKGAVGAKIRLADREAICVSPQDAQTERAVLYIHGGHFCLGEPQLFSGLAGILAENAHAQAFLPNYRLAPEHPFPAAIEDCVKAYVGLLQMGKKPRSIAICGDGAGANLAIACALSLIEAGAPTPSSLALFSPWVDLTSKGKSYEFNADTDPLVSKSTLRTFARLYLGDRDPAATRLASIQAEDFKGLPPLLIQVGANEALYSDAEKLKAKARESGVEANLEIWPNMIHAWHYFHAHLPEAQEALAAAGQWVARRMA